MESLPALYGNGITLWIVFAVSVGLAIAIDLGLTGKVRKLLSKQKDEKSDSSPSEEKQPFKQALMWTIVWIGMAGAFAVLVYVSLGYDKMLEFVTGYTLEKSLSVDNMFVFLLIFTTLAIPHAFQHKVLTVGILSAIAMRIPLILVGVSLLESFHWMVYVFGGLLVLTAVKMLLQKKDKKIEVEKNIAVRMLRKVVPVTTELNGDKFFTKKNGILFATPLLVALVMVEMTDLVFAIDSIPAILAITSDPFIVITSNIFAILGLRSLYFLLAGMMEKFHYLKPALVALLLFVGFKMIAVDYVKVPIAISLAVIGGILGIAIGLSYLKAKRQYNHQEKSAIERATREDAKQ
ncbi:tellurium ion resistance family protein [Candidatus Nitrososphaera gargensis Ga9.2]|uniref:Tellurium ion resistance family protein n=1 Tax=Nitrososphaera gargensis (strain Ga9.2) TaxID=1237085 RepID=K0ILC2_NITGG|nr:TerC family protein [Candidatus Nitrososphaera gargensis]AFU60313.1 tellurium ion resistance family protein [Candidatus Nitrososphaera gargensis Ga9.2]